MKTKPIDKQLLLSTLFCLFISCSLAAAFIIGFFPKVDIFINVNFWIFFASVFSFTYFGWRARSASIPENITAYFWSLSPADCRIRAREALGIAQIKEAIETEKEKKLCDAIDTECLVIEKEMKERKGK